MVDCLIAVNELDLVRTEIKAPRKQNWSLGKKKALEKLKNNPNIILKKQITVPVLSLWTDSSILTMTINN